MDPVTTNPVEDGGASENEETVENKGGVKSETPSNDDSVNVDDIVSSWKSDRERISELERENFELRKKSSTTKDEDEDDNLSIDERVEKRIAQKQKEAEEMEKFSKEQAEREATFMRKVSPTFRKNEVEIIKIAIDGRMNLSEATRVFETRHKAVADAKKEVDDERKKNAGQKPSSSKGGEVGKKGYDPKADKSKSISDMYRDGMGY